MGRYRRKLPAQADLDDFIDTLRRPEAFHAGLAGKAQAEGELIASNHSE